MEILIVAFVLAIIVALVTEPQYPFTRKDTGFSLFFFLVVWGAIVGIIYTICAVW